MADKQELDETLEHSRLRGLPPEARLLLATARLRPSQVQQESVHHFLQAQGADLDWGRFVDLACRHGLMPLVGRNLAALRLTQTAQGRTLAPYRWLYAYAYEGNRRRNLALADEYGKVLRGLEATGEPYAVRKGPVLTEGVYRDPGLRRMGDLDLLLHPRSLPVLADLAAELGYEQGHLSRNAERVIPFDRRTQLVWKVSLPNSTLPYLKSAGRDDVEAFVIDPCFNIFQPRSGVDVGVEELLSRARASIAFGEHTRVLDPMDQLIDVCVQIHVEATTLMYIDIGKDLLLTKFLDTVELLKALPEERHAALITRVAHLGCRGSVAYALHFADQVYPGEIPPALADAFHTDDPELLESYGTLDGSPQRWKHTFAERLFDPACRKTVTTSSTVPGPRAIV